MTYIVLFAPPPLSITFFTHFTNDPVSPNFDVALPFPIPNNDAITRRVHVNAQ